MGGQSAVTTCAFAYMHGFMIVVLSSRWASELDLKHMYGTGMSVMCGQMHDTCEDAVLQQITQEAKVIH